MRLNRPVLACLLSAIAMAAAGCGSGTVVHLEPLDMSTNQVTYMVTGPDSQTLLGAGRATAATVVAQSRAETASLLGPSTSHGAAGQSTPVPADPTPATP